MKDATVVVLVVAICGWVFAGVSWIQVRVMENNLRLVNERPLDLTDPTGAKSWIMDVHKPLYGKVDEHCDFWIGYQRKLTSKLDWRIQLNISNVGEKPHLTPVSVEPDGSWAQQRIQMGQSYLLTNTIKF